MRPLKFKIQNPRKPNENKQFIRLHNHGDSSCLMLISKNRISLASSNCWFCAAVV